MTNLNDCSALLSDSNELIVKGDICIYDDWFSTGDLVTQKNKIFSEHLKT